MALDPLTAGIGLVNSVVSRFWPDATESDKQKASLALAELQAQTDINKIEAGNANLFVSGWRPFVGWMCGCALLYSSLLEPILRFVGTVIFKYSGTYPLVDSDITFQVLMGLLGLGALRSYEKKNGVTR